MANLSLSVKQEADIVVNRWYSLSIDLSRTRVTKAVVQVLLLQDNYMIRGRLYKAHSKSIGAGIYEVWLESVFKKEETGETS